MLTPFSVDATLAGIVRPAALWWQGAEVVSRPAGLEAVMATVSAADQKLKNVTATAQPRDIVDIVVSEPIAIRVKAAK